MTDIFCLMKRLSWYEGAARFQRPKVLSSCSTMLKVSLFAQHPGEGERNGVSVPLNSSGLYIRIKGGVFKKYWSPLPYLAEIQTQLVEGKALVLVSLFFQQMFPLLPIHPISEGWIPALGMHAHHRGEINTTRCGVCTQERWEAASHYQEGWACLLVPGITALLEWFCRLRAGKTETPYSGPSRAPCPGRERNFGHLRLFQCARCWSSARYWALILGLLARQSMMEFPGWLVVEESTYSLLFFFSFAYYCPECDPYLFVL